jgi:tetratricopeptide (TPR) repeat protein
MLTEYRRVVALDTRDAQAYYNLGTALLNRGRVEEAIPELRAAIELQPSFAEAHCNLGQALRDQGKFTEALAEMKRGHDLGSNRADWRYPSARWVDDSARLVKLDAKLLAVLKGEAKPTDPSERLDLACFCHRYKKRYATASYLYAEAFDAQPKLADDPGKGHRYDAACAAALAAAGQGADVTKVPPPERDTLRRHALDWLRADLDAWGKLLDKEPTKARPMVIERMRHWLADSDFASVRGEQALAELPTAERPAWQKLWAGVTDTLNRAQGKSAPDKRSDGK